MTRERGAVTFPRNSGRTSTRSSRARKNSLRTCIPAAGPCRMVIGAVAPIALLLLREVGLRAEEDSRGVRSRRRGALFAAQIRNSFTPAHDHLRDSLARRL